MTILTERINTLTRDYNERIGAMKSTFNLESSTLRYSDKRKLKRDYSNRYNDLAREYQAERGQLFEDYAEEHPEWTKSRRLWGWIFALGAVFAVVCCGASMPSDDTPQPAVVSRLAENAEEVYWNADNIPIPYLQDSTQYVSNPDHVLSQEAVDVINVNMKRIEQEFDIQSVVIVVNHVENDDPFRMAQDVGNRYGVGRNDRGLVIVVGYGDHKINISPGRALEDRQSPGAAVDGLPAALRADGGEAVFLVGEFLVPAAQAGDVELGVQKGVFIVVHGGPLYVKC